MTLTVDIDASTVKGRSFTHRLSCEVTDDWEWESRGASRSVIARGRSVWMLERVFYSGRVHRTWVRHALTGEHAGLGAMENTPGGY